MTQTGLHLGELVEVTPPPPLAQAAVELITAPLSDSVITVENFQAACGSPRPRYVCGLKTLLRQQFLQAPEAGKALLF
jgi:hypothetical protein